MGNTKNIIEINGKRYDAVTGTLLGAASTIVHAGSSTRSKGTSVDGFTRVSRAQLPGEPLKPILQKIAEPVAPSGHIVQVARRPAHTPAKHAMPHAPQPAKTLMRSAVKKPIVKSPAHIKAHTRTDILAKVPAHVITPKLSHSVVDPARLRRATRMVQSPAVSKYSQAHHMPVHTIATKAATVQTSSPITATPKPQPAQTTHAPQMHSSQLRVATPRPAQHIARGRSMDDFSPPVHSAPRPATTQAAPKSDDIFEKALANARSHEQTFSAKKTKSRKSKQVARFATVAFSALLLLGFFGYQNMANLNMYVASTKAGFSAKMPGYSPAGFKVGNLSYQPGAVNLSYTSNNGDNRRFDISQKSSSWDSQALLSNFVAGATKDYQTYERAGRTVYLYGDNTATWVDNGVWYVIDGNTSLSRAELIDVAISI